MPTKSTAVIPESAWLDIAAVKRHLRRHMYGPIEWAQTSDARITAEYTKVVMAFQRDHTDQDGRPLVVDGLVGKKTYAVLRGPVKPPAAQPAPAAVSDLRQAIVARAIELGNAGIREGKVGNRGEPFDTWNRSAGLKIPLKPSTKGQPYCVSMWHHELGLLFAAHGVKLPLTIGASTSLLARRAKALGRLRTLAEAQPGDLVTFPFGHTGMLLEKLPGGRIRTCEGNTSAGSKGSQSNGDGVYIRTRAATACKFVNVIP